MLDLLARPARIGFKPTGRRAGLKRRTELAFDGREHGVRIVESARTQRLTLRLLAQPDATTGDAFKVTVPPGTPLAEINGFLARHADWAAEQLSGRPEPVAIRDGAVIPLRGIDTTIVHDGPGRRAPWLAPTLDGGMTLHVAGPVESLPRRVTDFLKREARADLEGAVECHAEALGVRPTSLTIRDTVSRWGSCSTRGALNFSWRIVLAPPEVLDYLAAHEVAHLREMNHSPRFWALVKDVCPDMETHRDWLRRHGATLHAVS